MNERFYALKLPGNPVVQVFSLLAAGAALIAAVLLGAVLLAVVLAIAMLAGAVFVVRLWWLRRKLGRAARKRADAERRLIEAEYRVIDEGEPRNHRRD